MFPVRADEAVDASGSLATGASRAASDAAADAAAASDALEGAAAAASAAAATPAVFFSLSAILVLNLPSAAAASLLRTNHTGATSGSC